MPRGRTSAAEKAEMLLTSADDPENTAEETAAMRHNANVYALLAIAEELAGVREQVSSVVEALKSPDGVDAGTSLYYAADWLKDIAERR